MRPHVRINRIVAWGVTWGLVTSVTEWLPFRDAEAWQWQNLMVWWLTGWMVPAWCLLGCVFVWVADRGERIAGTRGLIAGWLAVAVVWAAVYPLVNFGMHYLLAEAFDDTHFLTWGSGPSAPMLSRWMWLGLYNLWITTFYGGLLVAGYALSARRERTRLALHATAIARNQTEALLDRARLEILEGQIDPSLLLDTMRELQLRYLARPDRAERLLEALVEFLRCAMPVLREGESTLEAELRLASAYSRLQGERGAAGAWRIEGVAGGAAKTPFPRLFMLPLLALAGEGNPSVRTVVESGRTRLSLSGLTRRISDEFERRLRARLRALYGEHFAIDFSAASTQLVITLEPTRPTIEIGKSHDPETIGPRRRAT